MTMFRVETCTDPCGLNWSEEAASPAADDDYALALSWHLFKVPALEISSQHHVFHNRTDITLCLFSKLFLSDYLISSLQRSIYC